MIEIVVVLLLLGILACWVLLPLIPAVLIYWLFPKATVAVSGPLANLTVKASGAFAAYLIVFSTVIPWVNEAYDTVGAMLHPAWTINGRLRIVDKNGTTWHPGDDFFRKIEIRTQPEVNSFQDPTFVITVPEGPHGIPKIYLDAGIGPATPLALGKPDYFSKTIEISDPTEIKQAPVNNSDDRRPQIVTAQ